MNRLLTLSLLLSAGMAGSQTAAFAQEKSTMHCNFVGTVSPEVLDAAKAIRWQPTPYRVASRADISTRAGSPAIKSTNSSARKELARQG